MQHKDRLYKVISLLAIIAVLAIAWGIDQFLIDQTKLASATFNYFQLYGLSAACALILIALWFGLGWLVLFKSGYSRLIWIPFLIVGSFWVLVKYLWLLIPWPPLHRMGWALDFEYSTPSLISTTMFIAVLGLLNLALRSRSRLGE
ncbi:MAG: hypothetical protein A2W35_07360 [Chloroflexi bacterium RBG_16_57_11]|nr:MAG: hypothetical protein A2W35_07360 [Chloroflexi bacterium RBG_16_57_11]